MSFLEFIRACRMEAERIGAGDADATRQIFLQILKTWDAFHAAKQGGSAS